MTVFHAYLDASGRNYDEKVLTLSGFISSAAAWDTFSAEWANRLGGDGVKRFHANALNAGQKEFADWTVERRQALMRDLLGFIQRHTLASVSFGVSHEMYMRYVKPEVRAAVGGSPYFFLFLNAVLSAENMMDKHARFGVPGFPIDWKIAYTFARGDTGSGPIVDAYNKRSRATEEMWKRLRVAGIDMPPFNEHRAFEAADLLAWEARRQVISQLALRDERKVRSEFRQLEGNGRPNVWQFYGKPMHLVQNADIIARALLGETSDKLLVWSD